MLAIDQYGQKYVLEGKAPRRELMELLGVRRAQRMFVDSKGGGAKHVGYVIGGHWFTLFNVSPWEQPA
jgi:hypothetical protein